MVESMLLQRHEPVMFIYFRIFLSYITLVLFASAAPEDHLIGGIPSCKESIQVVECIGYIAGYSPVTRNPAWVAYKLSGAPVHTTTKRPRRFLDDPRVTGEVQHDDYSHSGYERGHLASNGVIGSYFGAAAQRETFYMTNIIPQTAQLNRGTAWRHIEQLEMGMGVAFRDVWIITGPVETDLANITEGGVSIPEGSFKIIADIDEISNALRVQAFLFSQDPKNNNLRDYLVSVDRVEKLTGLDFFPDFSGREDDIESVPSASLWITSADAYYSDRPTASVNFGAAGSKEVQPVNSSGDYWISSTGKTHRNGCRYYGKGNGRNDNKASGNNCKICGGADISY